MSYVNIPLQVEANQQVSATLDGVVTQITLRTTDYGLFIDVVYGTTLIASGRACLDRTDINSARYLGMPQALFFADLQGVTDPVYTGFGTRYLLLYGNPG